MNASSAYGFACVEKDIEKPRRVEAYWEDEDLFTLKVHGDAEGEFVLICLDAELARAVAEVLLGNNKDALDVGAAAAKP